VDEKTAALAPVKPSGAYDVGAVEDFEFDVVKIFELEIGSVGVVRTSRGFYAVRNRCPHMGAPVCRGRFGGTNVTSEPDDLVYGFREDVIRCPWHGLEFHMSTGESVYGMTKGRLITYTVDIEDGRVLVSRRRGGNARPSTSS